MRNILPLFPTITMIQVHMFRQCSKTKVFNSVVSFIPVNVMNYLLTCKFSTKMLFHYVSVLLASFPPNIYSQVAEANTWFIPVSLKVTFTPPAFVMRVAKNLRGVISGLSSATFNRTNLHINNDTIMEIA